jgi:hypothetical protein
MWIYRNARFAGLPHCERMVSHSENARNGSQTRANCHSWRVIHMQFTNG